MTERIEKGVQAYENYVCPHCWNTLDKCICEVFPPYHLIFIDKNIQEHIRLLNEKGYPTTGCCEGHMQTCINTYIAFPNKFFEDKPLPSEYKYDKKRYMISYTYSMKLSEEKFAEKKKQKLADLLEWIKALPQNEM